MEEKTCPRNLPDSEIMENFARDEEDLKLCNSMHCPNLKYQNGLYFCDKLSK